MADDMDEILNAPLSILPSFENDDIEINNSDNDDEDDALPIIAELSYEIELLSVDQAVMRLELSNQPCLMFQKCVSQRFEYGISP